MGGGEMRKIWRRIREKREENHQLQGNIINDNLSSSITPPQGEAVRWPWRTPTQRHSHPYQISSTRSWTLDPLSGYSRPSRRSDPCRLEPPEGTVRVLREREERGIGERGESLRRDRRETGESLRRERKESQERDRRERGESLGREHSCLQICANHSWILIDATE